MITPWSVSGMPWSSGPCSTTARASSSRKNGLPSPLARMAVATPSGSGCSRATESTRAALSLVVNGVSVIWVT